MRQDMPDPSNGKGGAFAVHSKNGNGVSSRASSRMVIAPPSLVIRTKKKTSATITSTALPRMLRRIVGVLLFLVLVVFILYRDNEQLKYIEKRQQQQQIDKPVFISPHSPKLGGAFNTAQYNKNKGDNQKQLIADEYYNEYYDDIYDSYINTDPIIDDIDSDDGDDDLAILNQNDQWQKDLESRIDQILDSYSVTYDHAEENDDDDDNNDDDDEDNTKQNVLNNDNNNNNNKNHNDDHDHDERTRIQTLNELNNYMNNSKDSPVISSSDSNFVGIPVVSASEINRKNDNGHYWHDPYHSIYSSPLYMNKQTIENNATRNEQEVFTTKLRRTVKEYGQWISPHWPTPSKHNDNGTVIVSPEFDEYSSINRDIPGAEFPSNSWHLNRPYVTEFLEQAQQLIQRVKEGIYTEYGMGLHNNKEITDPEKIKRLRERIFGIQIIDYNNTDEVRIDTRTGVAINATTNQPLGCAIYMNQDAYNGLVRKLLHSIITQDAYYVVVVSDGGHTYLGNNMFQTQIMQFQYLMEPVLDKLGITLFSRNMGMDTPSATIINALGGSDIYGEADILWHIPDGDLQRSSTKNYTNNKNKDGAIDLVHIQSILSGQRVPIILTPNPGTLMKQQQSNNTSGSVWRGNIQPGTDACSLVHSHNKKICQYVNCNKNDDNNDHESIRNCDENQYSSVCWIERSDWNPDASQNVNVGNQKDGYPNPNQHYLESRKLAMLVLHALDDAVAQWKSSLDTSKSSLTSATADQGSTGLLPPDSMWHVNKIYTTIRERVRNHGSTACGEYMQEIDPEICHLQMHAYTEWTPRVTPKMKRLKTLIEGDIADANTNLRSLYDTVDLLSPSWKIEKDQLDVHLIAIAVEMSEMKSQTINQLDSSIYDDDDKWDIHAALDDDVWGFDQTDPLFETDDVIPQRNIRNLREKSQHNHHILTNENGRKVRLLASQRVRRRKFQAYAISHTAWTVFEAPFGFCDGSSQSRCNRVIGNKCLLSNHNHFKAGIMGHGESGPLKLVVPNVKVGIILARFEWQVAGIKPMQDLPDDFSFIYTVNGKEHTKLSKSDFISRAVVLADDVIIHPLKIDKTKYDDKKNAGSTLTNTVELQMEIQTKRGQDTSILLTHLYFA